MEVGALGSFESAALHLVELFGGATWGIDGVGALEETVVDLVGAVALLVGDELLEAMAPGDLGGQIGSASLGSHAGALDDAFQQDQDLKLGGGQVLGGVAVEGRVLVDDVTNVHGPDEEYAIVTGVVADVHLELVKRVHFAFVGDALTDELETDVGLDEMGVAHVAYTDDETELSVLEGDECFLGEDESGGALGGSGDLGEDESDHE